MRSTGNTIFTNEGGSGIVRTLAEQLHKRGNRAIIGGRRKGRLAKNVEANPGMDAVEPDDSNHTTSARRPS